MTHTIILLVLFGFCFAWSIYDYFAPHTPANKEASYDKLRRKMNFYRGLFFLGLVLLQLQKLFPECTWL